MSESGIDQMEELRQRARRQIPSARHPPKRPTTTQPAEESPRGVMARGDEVIVDSQEESAVQPHATPSEPRNRDGENHDDERPVRRRQRVRATQVHLDGVSEDHLANIKKRAVMADVDLTNSAVLRLALAELVDRYGYDRIVAIFEEDDGRLRRGRSRQ